MRQFLALQEFTPSEQEGDGSCIWCGKNTAKNRAHIISRKLAGHARNTPILTRSVCAPCNTICGKVEDWILHNTPLGWARYFLYPSANRHSNPPRTPTYSFVPAIGEWLVHTLNPATRKHVISPQMLLTTDGQLRLFTALPPDSASALSQALLAALRSGQFRRFISKTLADAFRPRIMHLEENIMVVARTESDASALLDALADGSWEVSTPVRTPLSDCVVQRQHFRWSKENWVKFCAKIAFETLALLEGQKVCARPCFDRVRKYVLSGPSKRSREILFDEHGPIGEGDVPEPVCIDLSVGQNSPTDIQALLSIADAGMHSVTLCEMDGWICCSLSFAGLPPSFVILGGPHERLTDLFELTFDEQESEFYFTRLAFDPSKPVFPKEVRGNVHATLARTYGLRSA